ncbi:MAG: hypothetical protein CM1200mP30_07500 [Pseudomonadota bacterium]|nr:MAG: hypothetical protein CM1200mP30_07500 [Pseudomonadota bacterium]
MKPRKPELQWLIFMYATPQTGEAGRKLEWYKEVVERVRASSTDVVLNLTAGMGGDFMPDKEDPGKGRSRH